MLFGRSLTIPVPGLLFALLGLGWSVFMSLGIGTDFVCVTSGCPVVENVRIFGISPWWAAVALFALMAVLALVRLRSLAYLTALIFLLGDCLFLLVMLFLAPCLNCLILALILFCAWITLRPKSTTLVVPRRILAGTLGLFWLLLFLLNLGPVLNELFAPRLLVSVPNSRVSVYISPSCPACLQAARAFEGAADFYAVAENEADLLLLADLKIRLDSGQKLAAALEEMAEQRLSGVYQAPELSWWQEARLRFAVMRNQARLSRLGFTAVPVIMFEGLPAHWVRPKVDPATLRGPGPALPPQSAPPAQNAAPAVPPATPPAVSAEPPAEPAEPAEAGRAVPAPAEPLPSPSSPAPAVEGGGDGVIVPMLPDLPAELLDPALDCGSGRAAPCE